MTLRRPLSLLLLLMAGAGALGCKKPGRGDAAGSDLPAGATPVGSNLPASPAAPRESPAQAPLPSLESAPISFSSIAKHADPSVVTVNTTGEEVEASPFFGRVRRRERRGLGTGFVIEKDGTIVTNNHVIEEGTQITVQLSDEREFEARVVGRDPRTDIAVLHIDATGLKPIPLGDSDGLEVGDWVVAIGNPFGLSHTVSAGIISAKGRGREDVPLDPAGYYNFLQTDASINPGNSGGPLLNLKGEVVGVNTAIRGGGAQGIGFAIPINMVKQLLPMLKNDGKVTRSALAVQIEDVRKLTAEDKSTLKLKDDRGAVLVFVEPSGPAGRAGLRPGDVIVAFDGKDIERGSQLQWLASTTGVGRTVTVRVSRDGQLFEQKVTLGELREAPTRGRQVLPGGDPRFGSP